MRLSPTFLAVGVTFLALGAQAQTAAKIEHPSNENTFSVFVYDRLGATPSLRMAPPDAKPAQNATAARKPIAVPQAGGEGETRTALQVTSIAAPARAVQ